MLCEFTNKHTNVIKGCAVILLLFHHLFYKIEYFDACITFFQHEVIIYNIIARLSKVCVAIFLLLSGYGLTKSADRVNGTVNLRFSFSHIIKIMSMFWFIYLLFVPLGFFLGRTPIEVYGTGIRGLLKFFTDFFGVAELLGTPTFNPTWWYMGEILRLYILFPVFYYGVKKNTPIMLIIVSALLIFGDFRWFVPFIIGMIIAEKNLFSKYMETPLKVKLPIVLIGLLIIPIRLKYPLMDTLFGLWIIACVLCFINTENIFGKFLEFAGKHSGNIFMFHTFIYFYYFKNFIYGFYHPILIFAALFVICLAVSVLIEKIKKLIWYYKFEKKLQSLLIKT